MPHSAHRLITPSLFSKVRPIYFMYISRNLFCSAAFPIPVTIADSLPDQGPVYSPGSELSLTCSADGRFGPFMTSWTSTCTGSCFVLQQSSQETITTAVLHSVDSGNHTCSVVDDVGNTGYSTIEVQVSGLSMLYIMRKTAYMHYGIIACYTQEYRCICLMATTQGQFQIMASF